MGDECHNLDTHMGTSVVKTFLFLLRTTLEGSEAWECFLQSSAPVPGLLLHGLFLVVVTIMLLNTLIAMMSVRVRPSPSYQKPKVGGAHCITFL
jgi:hypothetical protein